MEAIIDYLKVHGEQMDADLARALSLPVEQVRTEIRALSSKGAVMMCLVTRYRNGVEIEGLACRISGVIPTPAPGRRPNSAKS